jgi:O-antigen ligase
VPLLAYFITKNLVSNQRDLNIVLIFLTMVGTFIGLYAIYEQVTGHILFADKNCEVCATSTQYSANIRILRGLFGGPGAFAMVFTQIIPISFVLFFRSNHYFTRMLYGMSAMILIAGNYLSFRRTGWVAMIVSLLVLQWFYPQFRKLFFILMLIIVPVAAFNWERITESEVYQDRVQSNIETANGRTEIHGTMMRMWQAKPIFGWGYAEYVNYSGRFRQDGISTNWNDTQSLYWKYLVSGGLAAFLPFLGIFISLLLTSLRFFQQADKSYPFGRELIAVFWASLAAYLVNNYTFTEQHPFVHLIIFVLAGAIVGAPERFRLTARRQVLSKAEVSPAQPVMSATNPVGSEV